MYKCIVKLNSIKAIQTKTLNVTGFGKRGLFYTTCIVVLLALVGCESKKDDNTITLTIGSGHPGTASYMQMIEKFFLAEIERRVSTETKYKLNIIRAYSGGVVKASETLEGVQHGFVDFGAYTLGLEPSKLPLHTFQIMLPFGPSSPVMAMKVAQDVYRKEPFLKNVFEERYGQKLVGLVGSEPYGIGTNFQWNEVEELKGHKIAGAGLNLKWLESVGVTPVQGALSEAYISLETNVYEGWIALPRSWYSLKLHEAAPYFKQVNFGSIVWSGLTINLDTWNKLPPEVQDIVMQTGRDLEDKSAASSEKDYEPNLEILRNAGATISALDESVRLQWAQSLQDWPQTIATQLENKGYPASRVLNHAIKSAEQQGYVWPVDYSIQQP